MKVRPILFKPEMVAAILDGRKTQTRRLVKLRGDGWNTNPASWWTDNATEFPEQYLHVPHGEGIEATVQRVFNPFGHPGDRLWVRESFHRSLEWSEYRDWQYPVAHFADGSQQQGPRFIPGKEWKRGPAPSIHMPKWACRLRLEITEVRVERAQEITGAGFFAEGGTRPGFERWEIFGFKAGHFVDAHLGAFGYLWDSINGNGSWESNPWVWVVSFKKVAA